MTKLRWVHIWGPMLLIGVCVACAPKPTCTDDQSCGAPRVCVDGACQCPEGQKDCDGTCVSVSKDTKNCGECGAVCKEGFLCSNGACTCAEGQKACAGECIDVLSDVNNCGDCGTTCKDKEACQQGKCVSTVTCETPTLPVPCGGTCVNTLSDNENCGACGNVCANGSRCRNGVCECPLGQATCGGACVVLAANGDHCGSCDNKCADGAVCADGKCVKSCPGTTPQTCDKGCVDLTSDPYHCGTCGKACAAGQVCKSSACACPQGTTSCDAPGGKGKLCVDTSSSWQHCGGCGKACKAGEVCAEGACVATCPAASSEACYGSCFDTKSSPLHCGGCGKSCDANQSCKDGACACEGSLTLCDDANSANKQRCVDTSKDGQHCGKCGNACKAGLFCIEGTCQEYKTSCDDKALTACSGRCVDLQTDASHCGKCNNSCPNNDTCEKGLCSGKPNCQAGTRVCGTVCCPSAYNCCDDQCVNPDTTPEVCDGKDNDCDGQTDEDPVGAGESCVIEKNKGPCREGKRACENGSLICKQVVTAKPKEDCSNGIDDDCDGVPDGPPDCSCTDGQTRPCGIDKGECKLGKQTCKSGAWSSCEGEVIPSPEVCDGKDNNCDGIIDDGNPESGTACKSAEKGACEAGTTQCKSGKLECVPTASPSQETCNNIDDDCDGQIDNGVTRSCFSGTNVTPGTGICKSGTQTCSGGQWGTCENEVLPATETCNGLDDNCDGTTDEGCSCQDGKTQPCGSDTGECKKGTQTCVDGKFGECKGQVKPSTPELCDNKDDDCDGKVDNGFNLGASCTVGTGACQENGKLVCNSSQTGTTCDAIPGTPGTETCNNIDDDCNGKTDEGLHRPCYTGASGTAGVGTCIKGTETCQAGKWANCKGEKIPTTEVCDGKDNDCDGQTDEDAGCSCTEGDSQACGIDKGECTIGTQKCVSGAWDTCTGQGPIAEICNGKDDNCDGTIDESFPDKGQSCTVGTGGCAKTGVLVCKSDGSGTECDKTPGTPSAEVCDGIDNDCDGTVDEGDPGGGVDCYRREGGLRATCRRSKTRCVNGKITCIAPGNTISCSSNSACSACPSGLQNCGALSRTCGQ